MADINVGDLSVEHGATQIVGDPFKVTVPVKNQATVAPMPWKESRCEITKDNGKTVAAHEATVEVDIRRGEKSYASEKTTVCAPIQFTPALSDPRPSWEFQLYEPGEYDIVATITPAGSGQSSTKRRSITVDETGQQRPAEDGNNNDNNTGLDPLGDADGDGVPNVADPAPNDASKPAEDSLMGQLDKLVLVAALIAVAWLANSGAEVLG
jgi:hypothetical protein